MTMVFAARKKVVREKYGKVRELDTNKLLDTVGTN